MAASSTFKRLERRRTGERIVEAESQMGSIPYYGGCARCHSAYAISNGAYTPGFDPELVDPADVVSPAGSVIFPAGLYPDP